MDPIIESEKAGTDIQEFIEDTTMVHVLYAANTVCRFNYNGKEYTLVHNEFYQLPTASDFVQSLIGQGRLLIQ